MEEDIHKGGTSSSSSFTKKMEKIEGRLKEAIELAEERQSYESAHNDNILRALAVVADFIKKKRRVCYGGTAMNALLPEAKRFYNPEYDLPDYDFYTPDTEGDVAELVKDLKAAGFKDVYHRVGIHEGTKKILVDFVAVADVSHIESDLFSVFLKRSIVKEGIHYTDPDILRMMMYLELSRPKGDVGRWEKVFERLQLINEVFPVKGGATAAADGRRSCRSVRPPLPERMRDIVLNYIIEHERVLCNGPLVQLYEVGIRKGRASYERRGAGAMLFTSPDPKEDAKRLKSSLERVAAAGSVAVYLHKARGEIVPERYELRVGGEPACMILGEVACHAYNPIPLKDGRTVYVGSLEFLITLYLSLHIFTRHSEDILGPDAMCSVRRFVELAMQNYGAKRSQFPAFPLTCKGHQTGYVSLLRQKVLRIQKEKAAAAAGAGQGKTKKAQGRAQQQPPRKHRSAKRGTQKKRGD